MNARVLIWGMGRGAVYFPSSILLFRVKEVTILFYCCNTAMLDRRDLGTPIHSSLSTEEQLSCPLQPPHERRSFHSVLDLPHWWGDLGYIRVLQGFDTTVRDTWNGFRVLVKRQTPLFPCLEIINC